MPPTSTQASTAAPELEPEPRRWRGNGFWWPKLPIVDSLRGYTARDAGADAVAGLTVAAVAVPQSMAYAAVAGLPVEYGLYTAVVSTAVGSLFDASRHLVKGPTNAVSIAVFSALADVPDGDRVAAAILLALLVGIIQLGITFLRLGDFTRYISHSVIVGFTLGAATLLLLGQMRHALGVPSGGVAGQSFLGRLWATYAHLPAPHAWTVGLTGGTIVLLVGVHLVNRRLADRGLRIPEFLIAMLGASIAVWALELQAAGVETVGALPRALPGIELPTVQWARVESMSTDALAVAVLGLLESIAMAKSIAARTGQKLDMNQQCFSEGISNATSSLFQCYPGAGSLTRSALNEQAGARTQVAALWSAAAVAMAVLAFAPLAVYIPRAALAAMLIVTAVRLVDRRQLAYYIGSSRFDATVVAVTALTAVLISVEFCLLVGVFMSFVLYVPRAAAIHLQELTVVRGETIRQRVEGDPHCSVLGLFNLEGEMFFGAAPDLEAQLEVIEAKADDGAKILIIRVRELRNPDAVCLEIFERFVDRIQAREGVRLFVCGIQPPMARALQRSGLAQRLGDENLFYQRRVAYTGMREAVERAYELLGDDLCQRCPNHRKGQSARAGRFNYMI